MGETKILLHGAANSHYILDRIIVNLVGGKNVGLEISACTGHTRHETLWESLCLANKVHSTCRHEAGSVDCLNLCWANGPQNTKSACVKLNITMGNFAATEINQKGSLMAFWPFMEAPAVYPIEPGTANSWFCFVRDTPDIATFVVLSNRCLQVKLSGKSMAECSTQSGGQGTTALSTQAMLDPDSPEPSVGTVYWIDDMYLTTEKVWKTETSQGILARTGGNWFYQKLSSHGQGAGAHVVLAC